MSVQQLIATDKAFNDMAQKEGTGKAFIAYSAEDPVMIRPGSMPLLGRTAFVESFSQVKGSALSWEPLKAEIAASQDLGYTFGRYTLREDGAIKAHGVYVSIWKKQSDGSWKFVLDGGGTTPEQVAIP
ncbi:nuclear transport factor 2 family protein [Microvirga sp. CF3062]|uniref:YybH family protein n=1 Tax=Microvirga sp. CF3062 TaxID=3110182 RepID=UPI002E77557D|nr:nuclear transport factor 2 family protein [Microvirga sp. CF3062]MEE1655967.1 nuclear transport factor 2 family protein [Microvirga sp. CF3062]